MIAIITLTSLFFLVILVSGFRLHRAGKPYGTLLLTLHKLVALGALVYLILNILHVTPISMPAMVVGLLAGFFFVLLIASGGWISAAKQAPEAVLVVHKVLPYLAILATAAVLYMFFFTGRWPAYFISRMYPLVNYETHCSRSI